MFWTSYFFLTCKTDLLILVSGYSESLANLFYNTCYFLTFNQCSFVQCFLHLVDEIIIIIILIINMDFIKI